MSLFKITFPFGFALPSGFVWPDRTDEDTVVGIETHRAEVELPGYGKLRIKRRLNFMGDSCLRTNLVTKKALAYSQDGEVIEITTDNPSSVETIPFILPQYNCKHLGTIHDELCWKIYSKKGMA